MYNTGRKQGKVFRTTETVDVNIEIPYGDIVSEMDENEVFELLQGSKYAFPASDIKRVYDLLLTGKTQDAISELEGMLHPKFKSVGDCIKKYKEATKK